MRSTTVRSLLCPSARGGLDSATAYSAASSASQAMSRQLPSGAKPSHSRVWPLPSNALTVSVLYAAPPPCSGAVTYTRYSLPPSAKAPHWAMV